MDEKMVDQMIRRISSIVLTLIIVLAFASPGWAADPDINVHQGGTNIPSPTGSYDFGSQSAGSNTDVVFTIQNTRKNSTLNLTGNPIVQLSGDPEFAVLAQPGTTVLVDQSETTFTIRFSPAGAGSFSTTVTIPNDDPHAAESPYIFTVQGTGTGAPEIRVTGNGQEIISGDITPDSADGTLFLDTGVGSTRNQDFIINNDGNADLTLGTVTVGDTTNFEVLAQPSTPVAGPGSTSVTIRFKPQSGATFTTTVTIPHNDNTDNENPYTFDVRGTGLVAAPTVANPSVANVEDTTATLGGEVINDGGDTPSEVGIYWSANFSNLQTTPPTGTRVLGTGSPTFAANVTLLDPGALLYFRAFALNTAGEGYATTQAFQTEPDQQPTNLQFSGVSFDQMTIGWTPQGGYETIVVVKEGGAVDVDPADFNVYTAGDSNWNSGSNLFGSGNYVVYVGSGSSVTIQGLASNTTYGVAVYSYAGAGGTSPDGINYQQDGPQRASDSTPSGPPSLSNPTITGFATDTSATLGATIDTDGGSSISEHGTVWGESANPTGNASTLGTATPPYTWSDDTRTGLPAGKKIYFRGYATNASLTGYSQDGIFYTEPDTQASGVSVSNPSFNSLDISWTEGARDDTYDGSIVVVRKGDAVVDHPVDGNAHAADSVFEAGDELGAGNDTYVVYRGTAISVTVTGLIHNTTYYVAVYEYSGSGSKINYRLGPATASGVTTKAPSHREAYGIECGNCHAHNGWGTFIPRDADQQDLCKTCHVDGGQAANKKDVAIHTGDGVTTDCGSCHEVHKADSEASPNNVLWTTDFRTSIKAENLNWLRGNVGKYVSGAAGAEPVIFHNATYASEEFARADTDTNAGGYLDGLCQACHTNPSSATKYHTNHPVNNPPEGPNAYTHPTERGDYNPGDNCLACHEHSGGFAPTVTETNCLAAGCHIELQGNNRQIVETSPGAGDGDFGGNMFSHHVNDGLDTSGQPALGAGVRQHPQLTRWDCVTCHAEGDAVTGAITSYHIGATKTVDLRNADGSVTSYTDASGVYNDWPNLTPAARSEFCMSCHDSDGATIIQTRTDPDPDATTDPLNPYNDGVTNGHEPDGFDGTPAPHSRTDVVDIKSKFAVTNTSHHAVLGPAYGAGSDPFTAVPTTPLDTAVFGTHPYGGAITWTSTLECEDCHVGTDREGQDVKLVGHGTVNSRYMLRDRFGNDALGDYDSNFTIICLKCHDPNDDLSTGTSTTYAAHNRAGDHMTDANNLFGIGCLNCHGGGIVPDGNNPNAVQWGTIHGVNIVHTDNNTLGSYNPNVFSYGAALDLMDNWTASTYTCSGVQNSTLLNDCGQHSTRTSGAERVYPSARGYRYP